MISPFPTYRPSILSFEFQITVTEESKSFTLPLTDVAPGHNFVVAWGDGSSNTITAYDDADRIHNYANAGTYDIKITGLCSGFQFKYNGDRLKVDKVISWGNVEFRRLDFDGCQNLTTLPNQSGKLTLITTFEKIFKDGSSLLSIPSGIFDNNTIATSFSQAFYYCNQITSIPIDLFKDNIAVTSFHSTFMGASLVSIPTDLFRYNTAVTTFKYTFRECSLASVPTNLFKYNTLATNFKFTFESCTVLQLNANIFWADGERDIRFLNQSINFEGCFYRMVFTGTQGIAPDLWNCDFGEGTPTKTDCWDGAGNSLTSLSNYASIPEAWL